MLEILVCVLIFIAKLSCDFKALTFCLFPVHIPQEEEKCSVSFLGKPWQCLLPISGISIPSLLPGWERFKICLSNLNNSRNFSYLSAALAQACPVFHQILVLSQHPSLRPADAEPACQPSRDGAINVFLKTSASTIPPQQNLMTFRTEIQTQTRPLTKSSSSCSLLVLARPQPPAATAELFKIHGFRGWCSWHLPDRDERHWRKSQP